MAEEQPETKQELFKHSATIQIEGNITLLQRKTWNVLLWNAYEELSVKEIHSIPVLELSQRVGYDSHDQDYLKGSSLALMRCILEYNILGKDGKNIWGAMVLLAQARIEDGIFTYAYPPELRKRLHNPDMYARLDLNLQACFDSKYALALWELCADYLGSRRDYGETPFVPLVDFRKLMGIGKDEYRDFRDLNKRVILQAISEINKISDFRVSVDCQRNGRRVTALKFRMRRVALLPEHSSEQGKLFPDLEDMPMIVRELRDAGLSTQDALEIWQRGFLYVTEGMCPISSREADFIEYIREKIHLLKRRRASGKVDNSTGFLREAIKKSYANPEYRAEKQKEARREQQQAAANLEKKRKELEQQKAAIEATRDKELKALYGRIMQDEPDVIEQAVAMAMKEAQGFNFLYDQGKTALKNYQDRLAIQALLNPYVERHASKRFEEIKTRYTVDIAAIDNEISSLKDLWLSC